MADSIHPDDATRLGIADGDAVRITSRRGEARSTARIDASISPGCVFLPIHWNELWAAAASPNEVTTSERDSVSKQPALKYSAVAVSRATADGPAERSAAGAVTAGR